MRFLGWECARGLTLGGEQGRWVPALAPPCTGYPASLLASPHPSSLGHFLLGWGIHVPRQTQVPGVQAVEQSHLRQNQHF